MNMLRRAAAVLVLATLVLCASVRAQVLDQVPDQALFVVKVSNLQAVSQKIGKLATDLQLTAPIPPLADPLGALQAKTKITAGLDTAGEAAFAFIDPTFLGGDSENSALILLPVTDYKAFLGNFTNPQEENGVTQVTLNDSPKPGYIANWGKYAVISPSKEIAALKPTGLKVAGVSAKEASSKDLIFIANMVALRAKFQPMLAQGRESILNDVEQGLSRDPNSAKYAPLMKVVVNQLLNLADAFLRDAQSASFGVSIGETGISSTLMAEFSPDSYMGNLSKVVKNSDKSMLTGIPAGKYLFYGGAIADPQISGKVFDDFVGPVQTELKSLGDEQSAAIDKYLVSLRKYVVSMTGQSFGMVAPTGAIGQEPIFQIVGVQTGDIPAMQAAYKDMTEQQHDMMSKLGLEQPGMETKTTFTANAKTVDDVSFDLTHTDFNFQNNPAAEGMLKMMYGPNGLNAYTGKVGDSLLVGFGISDVTLSTAIAAVKTGDEPLAKLPAVTAVAAQLPKSRMLTLYVPLDQIITTVGSYAGAMGMPIQIQLPPDLPPIGIAYSTDGTAYRVDSFTSTDLIKALVAQGMQLYMQRMGGPQPGGPGGL